MAAALAALAAATAPTRATALEALPASGRIVVHVFKRGLLSAFAHDHHFDVTRWRVTADVPGGDPARASVEASLAADSLRDRQTALSDADRRKVDGQAAGPDGLDAAGHPEVTYRSTGVKLQGGAGEGGSAAHGTIHGELTLRGRTGPVDVTFEAERGTAGWRVRGRARLKQSDFGIEPFSGFGGTIGVKDEVEIELAILLAAPAEGGPASSPEDAAARGAAPR